MTAAAVRTERGNIVEGDFLSEERGIKVWTVMDLKKKSILGKKKNFFVIKTGRRNIKEKKNLTYRCEKK